MNTHTTEAFISKLGALLLASTVLLPGLHAATRTTASGDYSITAESSEAGGGKIKGGPGDIYRIDSSIGGVVGLAVASSPLVALKAGYAGQLYDATALVVSAAPATVNETATRQLSGVQLLDDSTLLTVSAAAINWSVFSGPITSISAAGLAMAGTVFQNTQATVQGAFGGFNGSLNLTVLDSIADNFGAYAGDGVGDDWQVQYFGAPPNANAGPNVDFDGTGQTNLFKYIAGLNPLDAKSRFILTIQSVPGQPGQRNVIFAPRLTDRTYTVTSKPGLASGSYVPLTNPSAPSDSGPQRTITDLSASGAVKFYRVEITRP